MQLARVSENDLQLINALQIAPRASWSSLGSVLKNTPSALAARWNRLQKSGASWVTAYPVMGEAQSVMAYVELDCEPGARAAIYSTLAHCPEVVTIEESARGRDLLLTVICASLQEITVFALDRLPAINGVIKPRTHFVTRLHTEGNRWRLNALDPTQQQQCERLSGTHIGPSQRKAPHDSKYLVEALAQDARISAAEIARSSGKNLATVRRQVGTLLDSGMISIRCEVAQGLTQWPVTCTYLSRVQAADLDRTVSALKTLPELRVCVSTTGSTNLLFSLWSRSISELYTIEHRFGKYLPWLEIVDSAVTLRNRKRMGWLLNENGTATGEMTQPAWTVS